MLTDRPYKQRARRGKYRSNLLMNNVIYPGGFIELTARSYPIRVKTYKHDPNRKHTKRSTFFTSTRWAVITLFGIMIFTFILGMLANMMITDTKANEMDYEISKRQVGIFGKSNIALEKQNKDLALDLRVATAKPKPQILNQDEAKEMIAEMFPQQFRQRFFDITAHCENSALKSDALNINKDKDHTEDVGMSQVNNKYHSARVAKMFGLDFDVAMRMPILNYIYAAYLVDHDQNFHQWSCERILSGGKA